MSSFTKPIAGSCIAWPLPGCEMLRMRRTRSPMRLLKSRKISKKIEPVSPKTKQFVVTIVDHRATDLLRARGRHPESPYLDALAEQAAQPVGEDLLTQCIFQLPEQQRTVIWLKYYHGYTLREIAKLMDISLAWAQKIDQRAKKKLEELYREGGGRL